MQQRFQVRGHVHAVGWPQHNSIKSLTKSRIFYKLKNSQNCLTIKKKFFVYVTIHRRGTYFDLLEVRGDWGLNDKQIDMVTTTNNLGVALNNIPSWSDHLYARKPEIRAVALALLYCNTFQYGSQFAT